MIQLKSVFGLIWTVKRTSKNGQFRTKQKQKKRVGLKCNAKLSTANQQCIQTQPLEDWSP
jgi:hypothetical protein